jgi:hypothetical protein
VVTAPVYAAPPPTAPPTTAAPVVHAPVVHSTRVRHEPSSDPRRVGVLIEALRKL